MAKKHTGPRLVNPDNNGSTKEPSMPWKTIVITAMVTSIAGAIAIKVFEHVWEKGKQNNPFRAVNPTQHAAVGPFQSPYAHMAQTQGLPFQPPEVPQMESVEEAPPKWAQQFMEAHEARMASFEQRLGPQIVEGENAA